MRIEELKVDEDYKKCLPELSSDEYTNLERNILKHGLLSPIIIWDKTIIDGHNRYSICKAHMITEVPVKEMTFDSKESALEWILGNQLSRRNLTDYQKNVIALRYKEVIQARMKERMSDGGKGVVEKTNKGSSNEQPFEKSSTRKEIAKIAGTNESSVQRTELILKNGTEEQKERAMRGGKGNSISAIAKEIKAESEPQRICTRCGKAKPISQTTINGGSFVCLECERKRCREKEKQKAIDADEYKSIDKTVERIKSGEFIPYTREDVLEELKRVADGMKDTWNAILEEHADITENDETILSDAFNYLGQIFRKDEHYANLL